LDNSPRKCNNGEEEKREDFMPLSTEQTPTQLEIDKRIQEYRRIGFERRLPAQVVYQPPFLYCPWPNCNQRIDGIHFQLEQWLHGENLERLLRSWWSGSGLVARCPGCRNLVLFGLTSKAMVLDPSPDPSFLPDDWAEKAHLVIQATDSGHPQRKVP
jgi:hypothetical protein